MRPHLSQSPTVKSLVMTMQILDQGLHSIGVPYSYGFAIILLTIIVKLATFPLSKAQVCLLHQLQLNA